MNNLEKYGVNQRFINEATLYEGLKLARIISQYKGMYKIVTELGECFAEVSGKFRYEVTELSDYPAVGDFVMISSENTGGHALIHHILTRKSSFERTAVGISNQKQIIATNIDIAFICMSLNNNYNLSRIERYLSIAWDSGATPVIILTKSDLCENIDEITLEINSVAIGTDIIVTSAFEDDTISKLNDYLKSGITASFIGSSGVGKSTLINKLMGNNNLSTSAIGKDDKGRHTTTGKEMLLLPNGAIVIDTPGMREIGVESVNLSKSFSDIEDLAMQCKFSDCTHTKEPDCAVIKAIENGELDERRFLNYIKIKKEAKYNGLSSKQIESEKLNTMFSEIGGMKKAKNYIKQNDKRNFNFK